MRVNEDDVVHLHVSLKNHDVETDTKLSILCCFFVVASLGKCFKFHFVLCSVFFSLFSSSFHSFLFVSMTLLPFGLVSQRFIGIFFCFAPFVVFALICHGSFELLDFPLFPCPSNGKVQGSSDREKNQFIRFPSSLKYSRARVCATLFLLETGVLAEESS